VRVHQLLSGAGPYDAITAQARAYRKLMKGWGIEGRIYADSAAPGVEREVRPTARLADESRADDVLLVHYSIHSSRLGVALELFERKLLIYHNITPPRYLWDYQPHVATLCAIGRDELRRLASRFNAAAAVSAYNARELEAAGFADVAVIPNLFDEQRLEPGAGEGTRWDDGKRNVIFVGRVAPHKRHDDLLRAFAIYQRHLEPDSRLIMVGEPLSPIYRVALEDLSIRLGVRDAIFTGALPQRRVNAAYAASHAFLCLSEHEGFCIPLLEAMHFDLPILAREAGGVPEVAGDAAIGLGPEPDPGVVAEALHMAVSDEPLRTELAERGRRRLAEFSPERTAEKLKEWLESSLAISSV